MLAAGLLSDRYPANDYPDVISLPMIVATPLIVYLHPDLDWKSAALGVTIGGYPFI